MPETTASWSGFADYAPEGRTFDEMVSARGVVRPHGAGLVGALEALGPAEMSARLEAARQTIRDHDVTYNVYGDPLGMDRPWQLDIVPLPVAPDSWARFETALAQRARLLDLILADLYDGQRLLRDRLLPPALVYANPGFLRPCHGLPVIGGRHLHLHAADLARTPDGTMWVLADRTQAPSGAGYALENRIALSRSLPEAFRDCRVQRLAPFFRGLREMLHAPGAATDRRAPRRAAHAGPLQRNVFRARLSGPLSRLHARRRRRPDRPRRGRLPEDGRGPAAGRRRAPPHGRRLLRSAGAARRLVARRRRPGPGGAGRTRRRGQRARQRTARDAGDAALPARAVPAPARRGPGAAVGADVVVRPAAGVRSRHRAARRDGDQAGVLAGPARSRLRRAAVAPRARGAGRRDPRPSRRVRRPDGAGAVDGAGVGRGTARAARDRGPRLRRRRRRRLRRDARRVDAGGRRHRVFRRVDAERRRQQGHLDPVGWAGRAGVAAGPGGHARSRSIARPRISPAASPTTCSGWDATPSAARTWCACSAPRRRGWSRP